MNKKEVAQNVPLQVKSLHLTTCIINMKRLTQNDFAGKIIPTLLFFIYWIKKGNSKLTLRVNYSQLVASILNKGEWPKMIPANKMTAHFSYL